MTADRLWSAWSRLAREQLARVEQETHERLHTRLRNGRHLESVAQDVERRASYRARAAKEEA